MYTPDSLLAMATAAESRYQVLLQRHPPGTVNDERNAAREQMDAATACAAWMEQVGLTSCPNVGPFTSTRVARGQRVRIRRGARVFGTGSAVPREGLELQRAQGVTLHSVDEGYVIRAHGGQEPAVVQGKVTWAGSGGYWRWTDINNVEAAEES